MRLNNSTTPKERFGGNNSPFSVSSRSGAVFLHVDVLLAKSAQKSGLAVAAEPQVVVVDLAAAVVLARVRVTLVPLPLAPSAWNRIRKLYFDLHP